MHTDNVRGYDSMVEVTNEIGSLSYGATAFFLDNLSEEFIRQGEADHNRQRNQLSRLLIRFSSRLSIDSFRMNTIDEMAADVGWSCGSKGFVNGYDYIGDLVSEIGNLKYDAASLLFQNLAVEYFRQGDIALSEGHGELSHKIHIFSSRMFKNMEKMDRIWKLCEPYMKK